MRIAFGHHTVELRAWPSEKEMKDHVLACMSGSLILGEDARQYRGFFSTEFRLGFSGLSSFGIGLFSEGHGLVPHLLLLPEKGEVLFGFNKEVAFVNVFQKRLRFRLILDSLFRCFIRLIDRGTILVFHEFGVVSIDEAGNEQWSYGKDVLDNCLIDGTTLELHFLDEPSIRLNVSTGKPV